MVHQTRRSIPPLKSLVVFDSAVRMGSFSRAGLELGLTQSAVSRQINNLEEFIGLKLFRRLPTGIQLTSMGEVYSLDVRRILDELSSVTNKLRSWTGPQQITLACSRGIADQWLSNRIIKIKNDIPDIEIRLIVIDNIAHLRRDEFDLAIFYQKEKPLTMHCTSLGQEEIVPVQAPSCAPLHEQESPVFISIDDVMRDWLGWSDWWLSSNRSPPPSSREWRLGDYGLCIQAAMQGAGITLGWTWLIRDQLKSGTLVKADDHVMTSAAHFYLMRPLDRHQRKISRQVSQWIIDNNQNID